MPQQIRRVRHLLIKQETGSTMVDFLNQIRIEKSRNPLADYSVHLIKVVLQSGSESQSYFNRLFREETGMTPLIYRKLMSGRYDSHFLRTNAS